ncbi:MAG TPA: class I poly(R)-hydroxyalkanoic acid synthase [Candidatus Elarobacter sp.]|jgi:polyhydroxyalkanoate synthase|nr:class I poly(R)-hydroxyalkanoic acid synthase [Candidatus Elarobacter sp.]
MSAKNPFDPLGVGAASMEVWRAMMTSPGAMLEAQAELAKTFADAVKGDANAAATAKPPGKPIVEPAPGDRRFTNAAWLTNPYLDALKQAYLLSCKAVLDAVDGAEGIDEATKRRVKFFAKQFTDAMSPTNVPWFNPDVLEETVKSGGANFQRGLQNLIEDARENEGRPALVDESAFEVGKNVATTRGSVVFRNELIELIQYAPTRPEVYARPLVIVPPWINKFYILDLQAANSFVKYATDEGRNTFVISWRNPDASLADLTWADYMKLGPLAAIRVACEIAGSENADAIGYCIGGTLLATALAFLARTNANVVNTATFFAALVDFQDPGEIMAFLSTEALAHIDEQMAQDGVLSGRAMADTFSMLRANDLIWGVAVNRYLLGREAPAFDLLYWNSDATRVPRAAHSYYLKRMYIENALVKPDALEMDGVPIDLRRITLDAYCVATAEDHIAPWRSVYAMTRHFGGETAFRLGASGHIAGIISPPQKKKAVWWGPEPGTPNPADPDAWLAAAPKHEGSWWPDWTAWLAKRSPEKTGAPAAPGNADHPPLADAPGTYVLERA